MGRGAAPTCLKRFPQPGCMVARYSISCSHASIQWPYGICATSMERLRWEVEGGGSDTRDTDAGSCPSLPRVYSRPSRHPSVTFTDDLRRAVPVSSRSEVFSSRWGMLLAMLGMAVGTGNIWRFPRIAANNGGGSFLVAWVVFLLAWSIPLLILEFGMGKATRRGAIDG